MSKHRVYYSALLLALSGIIAKSADFIFRAYYATRLGREGMGLLSLVFGIHGVMVTVSTAGLGIAVSKVVSEYIEKNKTGAVHKSVKTALLGVSCLSLSVIFLSLMFAPFISKRILGDERTRLSICLLSPSILFMGISYCIKGYYYARRRVVIPASSEILEQAIKFSVSKTLLDILGGGTAVKCAAVFLGLSIGELSSCAYLSAFYIRDYIKEKDGIGATEEKTLKGLLCISVPTMLSSLITSVLRMQEEVLIVGSFKRFGMSHETAMSAFGSICGMTMPMIVLPLTLFGSVINLLVPEISRATVMRDKKRLYSLSKRVYTMGIGAGVVIMGGLKIFPGQLSNLVYGTEDIAGFVSALAILPPFMFADSISFGILNGMGKQLKLLKYNILDSSLRLIIICFLVPKYGINALINMFILSNIFTCILSARQVAKTITDKF